MFLFEVYWNSKKLGTILATDSEDAIDRWKRRHEITDNMGDWDAVIA